MAAEDAELMARYCDGDASAFRDLYARIAPPLHRYLLRLAASRFTADDLLQQTFLKLHRARAVYVHGADPVPWVYVIAHRAFLDHARSGRRSRVSVRAHHEVPAVPAHISGLRAEEIDPPARDPGLVNNLLEELYRLPENQREAIVLTKLEGKSIAEAAAIAGSTPGAIKLRTHRGYVALRKALAYASEVGENP